MEASLKRVSSIDIFRAITMLLMIFVNDLWTLSGIPLWLEHAEASQDFLGFADTIFPCFLFIVGMSIPFAIQNRIAKGDSNIQIVKYIIIRSIALLVMGIFTVNVPEMNKEATGMSSQWFQILMVIGFFLIWNVYPKSDGSKKYLFVALQVIGICLLLYLAYIFRSGEGNDLKRMEAHWWGILGLIGWSYLTCAIIYLFTYKNPWLLLTVWFIFTIINIAGHAGWLQKTWPSGPQDWILGNGIFHAFIFTGILTTLLLEYFHKNKKTGILPGILIGIGVAMIVIGLLLRNFFIISKIQATPPWLFLCSGIALIAYACMYFLVDLKGKANWFNIIKAAGTSTLTCYLIPYVYYSVASMLPISIPESLKYGFIGIIKSLLFSFLIIGITALLGRLKIKLKI